MRGTIVVSFLLASILLSSASVLTQQAFIGTVHAQTEPQVWDSHPNAYYTDLSAVTNPTYAYDSDLKTYASFYYNERGTDLPALSLYDFTSPTQNPALVFPPLPPIQSVDFYMRYNTTGSTENVQGWDQYRIVYYTDPAHVYDPAYAQVLQGYTYENVTDPTTFSWLNQSEPIDGVWDWTDINNIHFVVEWWRDGGADGGCLFWEYEAWIDVTVPRAKIRLEPQSTSELSPGSTFTVDVMADDVVYLWGYSFILDYDTAVLTATAVTTYAPFMTLWSKQIDDTAGSVSMSYSMALGATVGPSGSVKCAKITFSVDAAGGSLLDFHDYPDTKLTRIGSHIITGQVEIPADISDGTYGPIVPEFPLGMAIELALAVAVVYVFWKRRAKGTKHQRGQEISHLHVH